MLFMQINLGSWGILGTDLEPLKIGILGSVDVYANFRRLLIGLASSKALIGWRLLIQESDNQFNSFPNSGSVYCSAVKLWR